MSEIYRGGGRFPVLQQLVIVRFERGKVYTGGNVSASVSVASVAVALHAPG